MARVLTKTRVKWGALLWAALVVLVPLSAGWSLHNLSEYSRSSQLAGLHLEKLADDINGAAADMGWAVAMRLPLQAVEPGLRANRARVAADIANLAGDDAAGIQLADVEQEASSFMKVVAGATSLLDPGASDPTSFSQVEAGQQAKVEHDALIELIQSRAVTATDQAETAHGLDEAGIWLVVGAMSLILILGLWQILRRRRRAAVASAQRATMEEGERTYRLIFDRNPLPMFTLDKRSLRFVAVNDAATATYGYSRDEFLSMSATDLLPAEDRASFLETKLPSIRTMMPTSSRHLLKSGRVIDVEGVADSLDVGGQPIWLVAVRDVTAHHELEQQLKHLHDALTVLPNRALFVDRLEHALRHRSLRGLAVMLLDVDNFKAVNDSYGHGAGDTLLMEMAGRLQSCVRAEDTVARLGGDEFALVIEDGHEMAVGDRSPRARDAR